MGSIIYKELESNELQKIVADLYGNCAKIKESTILKGGLYNTTYLVKSDYGDIVIRVGPVNTHLLFDYEKDMMSSEPLFHKLLRNKGIPTSTILKYSPSGTVLDREYIISEYIDSIPMNNPSLSDINLDYIYSSVGSYTKKLHEISNGRFGWKRPDGSKEYSKWSDFILRFASECVDKAHKYSLYSQSDINAFWQYINDNEIIRLLDEIKKPQMTHTDLWQGNVLLAKKDEAYSVAAIIDLDRTIFGDTYWDFITPWMITKAFINGYGQMMHKISAIEKRGDIYSIINGFFCTYVVLVEYDDAEWCEKVKNETIEILHNVIQN